MSSVRIIIDDHPRGKKGEIVSVPFAVGREMIAAKHGEYPKAVVLPSEVPPPAQATPLTERHATEIARLNQHHAKALDDLKADALERAKVRQKEHDGEIAKLKADLDAAHKQITELQAQAKASAHKK